jgi:hypothetical protein
VSVKIRQRDYEGQVWWNNLNLKRFTWSTHLHTSPSHMRGKKSKEKEAFHLTVHLTFDNFLDTVILTEKQCICMWCLVCFGTFLSKEITCSYEFCLQTFAESLNVNFCWKLWVKNLVDQQILFFFFFFFYYSYVHTRLGSFLPPAPTPSLTTHSAPSLSPPNTQQKLFCPYF